MVHDLEDKDCELSDAAVLDSDLSYTGGPVTELSTINQIICAIGVIIGVFLHNVAVLIL
jgi:hypothetical protein